MKINNVEHLEQKSYEIIFEDFTSYGEEKNSSLAHIVSCDPISIPMNGFLISKLFLFPLNDLESRQGSREVEQRSSFSIVRLFHVRWWVSPFP